MSILNWFLSQDDSDPYSLDGCPKAQKAISKYGYSLTCPEDEVAPAPLIDPNCANAQEVASKYGFQITCPEM